MQVRLEYGRVGLEVEIPETGSGEPQVLSYRDTQPLPDPERSLAECLENPIGKQCLFDEARGCRDACILICDITRPVPNQLILLHVISDIMIL